LDGRAPTLSGREREELRRGTRLPLILVIVALVLAILLPHFTERRVTRLRDEINNLADPARLRVTGIQLELALQGSQRRGFLLTGDRTLATEFEASRERRIREEHELMAYSAPLDESGRAGLSPQVARLARATRSLDSLVENSRDVSAGSLRAQHDGFVAIQLLSDSLARKIDSMTTARRSTIGATENFVSLTIAGLLLLGLAAALLVERLGARFRTLALHLEEHAQEREQLLQRERAEHELSEKRRRELEQVTESRARLVRGFTHDVKNPLGAADGYLELLEDGIIADVSEPQRETIGRVRRSIRAALELIAHLLDIARAESGQLEIRRRPTQVADEVREVADAFNAQARSKRLAMELALEPGMPVVQTDPARLRQVVGNLISNAVKYTPQGGHVLVRTCLAPAPQTPEEREIEIIVSDDGPGIPRDKIPMLFTEFTRFDPRAAEGAGIGLAISKKIAQALGGDIVVETEVGRGASFIFQLPVKAPDRVDA
jgi:signal transduction histidine kinase